MNRFNRFTALRWMYNVIVPPRYRDKLNITEELCALESALNKVIDVTNANGQALEAISKDLEDIQFGAGGYYRPAITENEDGSVTFSFVASDDSMPPIEEKTFFLGDMQTITEMLQGFNGDPMEVKNYIDEMSGGYYTPVFEQSGNTVSVSFLASNKMLPALEGYSFTLPSGSPGKSAYGSYLDNGGMLSEKDWVDSLKGADGESFYQMCVKNGFKGSETDLVIAMKGVGIKSFEKTSTSGLVDTYTMTFTDDTTATFTVTNGKDGKDGSNGKDGSDGVGIKSIAKTSTSGLTDTYTITFTDNTTTTFKVTNGKDGTNGAGEEAPYIVLPSKLYAVVGREFVLYYRNILGAMRPEDFAITTEFPSGSTLPNREEPCIGAMFEWGLRIMPQTTHVGNHTLTIKVYSRSTWKVVATKSVTLVVSEEKTFSDKKVMFIGDSLTDACVYPAEIERMSNNGIKSVGTLNKSIGFDGGTANLNTEGRSGACSYNYVNRQTVVTGYANPFYNPDKTYTLTLDDKYSGEGVHATALPVDNSGSKSVITHHFDFAYYMANSGVEEPDAVFINLGSNCCKKSTYKTAYMSFCAMVDRIRAYSSTLPIFIHLCPPKSEAGSTDRKASGSVSGWVNRRTYFHEITQFLIDKFDGDSRVILVPTYTMIDPVYDFKRQTIPVSARNTEQITLGQSDGTHPATPGYLHMADSYYNILQALWSDEEGGETTYTVTNNLTNVTNSNTATSVKQGNAYTATLTAASGYTLDSVTVTMGGESVSVSGGTINIASVTGDIVITATATEDEEEPTVKNLVDPSTANDASPNTALFADEWVNGYKISTSSFSSNTLATGTDIITTDFIPVDINTKLRIEGMDMSTAAKKNDIRLVLFNADGSLSYNSYYTPTSSTNDSVVDQELMAAGTLLITIGKLNSAAAYPNLTYARICGRPLNGNNANIIVTVE